MYTCTIKVPYFILNDAAGYIRSAFTIPEKAEQWAYVDGNAIIVEFSLKVELLARFTCFRLN